MRCAGKSLSRSRRRLTHGSEADNPQILQVQDQCSPPQVSQ